MGWFLSGMLNPEHSDITTRERKQKKSTCYVSYFEEKKALKGNLMTLILNVIQVRRINTAISLNKLYSLPVFKGQCSFFVYFFTGILMNPEQSTQRGMI